MPAFRGPSKQCNFSSNRTIVLSKILKEPEITEKSNRGGKGVWDICRTQKLIRSWYLWKWERQMCKASACQERSCHSGPARSFHLEACRWHGGKKTEKKKRWYTSMTDKTLLTYTCEDMASKTPEQVNLWVIKVGKLARSASNLPRGDEELLLGRLVLFYMLNTFSSHADCGIQTPMGADTLILAQVQHEMGLASCYSFCPSGYISLLKLCQHRPNGGHHLPELGYSHGNSWGLISWPTIQRAGPPFTKAEIS